jgi:hypothetical protein
LANATTQRPLIFSPWRLPGWDRLRLLVVSLALAVGLASFMHVAHSHDENGTDGAGVSQLCSFCSSFDRGTAPPPAPATPPRIDSPVTPTPPAAPARASFAVRAAFRPRAPPHSHG